MFKDLLKNIMTLGIITEDDVKRLTAIELLLLMVERINGLLEHLNEYIESNDENIEKLREELNEVLETLTEEMSDLTTKQLEEWTEDGTFTELINETTFKDINDRLDNTIQALTVIADRKADKSQIGSTLVATSVAELSDTKKIYVNTSDGYWYSYNGSAWVKGALYQSQGIGNRSITTEKTDFADSVRQYLDNSRVSTGKYYWANGQNVETASNNDYKVFPKVDLLSGMYYFKDVIPSFSYIKNMSNNSVVSLESILVNSGDKHFNVPYSFEFYPTVLIGDNTAMLANTPLPDEYVSGFIDVVIANVSLREMKDKVKQQGNEIIELKNRNELKDNSIVTSFIKDRQVTADKTDFVEKDKTKQFLEKSKFETGKYYWWNQGNLNVGIAEHEEYQIYPKLSLPAGTYYFNKLVTVFSFIKYIGTNEIVGVETLLDARNKKFTVGADFELYPTYSATDTDAMLCNSELPNEYLEGTYNPATIICGYNLTKMQKAIEESTHRVIRCGSTREFTRLKDAIEEGVKQNGTYVYVDAETFDLVEEFGQEYLDNYNGREFGLQLSNDIHLIFDSGAKVVFNYQGTNEKVHEFFAPFNATLNGGGFELVNAWVESTNCRYSVHDEHAGDSVPYRQIYRHCTFIHDSSGTSWGSHQAIGGGLGTHGDIVVEDSYGKAVGSEEVFSWHNVVGEQPCKSNIVVRGCYLEGSLGFGLQGTYTDITRIFVSNCSLTRKPEVGGAIGGVQNMQLLEWNNEIRK